MRTGCSVAARNHVQKHAGGAGLWGGTCTCPNGEQYETGDSGDYCGSLSCRNGHGGECHEAEGAWSHRKVVCAEPGSLEMLSWCALWPDDPPEPDLLIAEQVSSKSV